MGDEDGRVHRPPRLRGGAGEVEGRLVAPDLDPHLHAERLSVDAVVVEPVLAVPGAVGERADRRPHLRFRLRVKRVEARVKRLHAVPLDELGQTSGRDVVGRELGEDVALALVRPAQVREDEVNRLALGPSRREESDRRDADAFLVAVGRPGHVAAGHGAADVRPVGEVDGERDEPVSREDGTDRLHVRQVIPADLREVEEPDVALAQPRRWDPLEELLDRERHHAHVDGNVPALGDEAPVGVGQRRGEVARFLEQRRAGRAHQDHAHLLGDRVEGVADDLERDGMNRGAHAVVSMTRFPNRSAAQRWPGSTRVVDHSSTTSAGPATGRAGPRAAR